MINELWWNKKDKNLTWGMVEETLLDTKYPSGNGIVYEFCSAYERVYERRMALRKAKMNEAKSKWMAMTPAQRKIVKVKKAMRVIEAYEKELESKPTL